MRSAYIHIPFCKQKCLYCDFNSFAGKECLIDRYIDALKQEIKISNIKTKDKRCDEINSDGLYTIYIGGGTPSFINGKQIKEIMELMPNANEVTIEANPGTLTFEKLLDYKDSKINRLSIGLQTADDRILKLIGRIHTVKEFEEAFYMARKAGFDNINVDLMFGLPTQTLENFKDSVEYVINLKPEHISSYSLILHNDIFKDLPSEETERDMYHYLVNRLKEAGYLHYEISNFALPGYESKHNLAYWEQREYYGFGAGASSYLRGRRATNECDINKYIEKVFANEEVKTLEEVETKESKIREYIILGLRKTDGISIDEINNKFEIDFEKDFANELKKLIRFDLIKIENGNVFLTSKGLDLANVVWEEFI